MVGVAQLAEPRVVIPVVVGSNPIVHPIYGIFFLKIIKDHFKRAVSSAGRAVDS